MKDKYTIPNEVTENIKNPEKIAEYLAKKLKGYELSKLEGKSNDNSRKDIILNVRIKLIVHAFVLADFCSKVGIERQDCRFIPGYDIVDAEELGVSFSYVTEYQDAMKKMYDDIMNKVVESTAYKSKTNDHIAPALSSYNSAKNVCWFAGVLFQGSMYSALISLATFLASLNPFGGRSGYITFDEYDSMLKMWRSIGDKAQVAIGITAVACVCTYALVRWTDRRFDSAVVKIGDDIYKHILSVSEAAYNTHKDKVETKKKGDNDEFNNLYRS